MFPEGSKKDSEATNTPFQFDVLTQLANIPTRITLYELRLSKITRDALREVLADSDAFLVQIIEPSVCNEDSCPYCHQVMRQVLYITFLPEDI